MKRDDLFDYLRGTPALREAQQWNSLAHDLLTRLMVRLPLAKQTEAKSAALWPLVLRMKRYLLALQRLSFAATGDAWIHSIDGAHAIHKSLFETYVEHALCIVYFEQFGVELDEAGDSLVQRMRRYSDFAKRRRNLNRAYKLQDLRELFTSVGRDAALPSDIAAFLAGGTEGIKADLKKQAADLQGQGARFTDLNHWFPESDKRGQFFGAADGNKRPRNCGSMDWRCKAVLARYCADPKLRAWWAASYDQYYDLLNLYAHPALGYDDNFRPDAERQADLMHMQIGIRAYFHIGVLPSLKEAFPDEMASLQERVEQLQAIDQKIAKEVLPVLVRVHEFGSNSSPVSAP